MAIIDLRRSCCISHPACSSRARAAPGEATAPATAAIPGSETSATPPAWPATLCTKGLMRLVLLCRLLLQPIRWPRGIHARLHRPVRRRVSDIRCRLLVLLLLLLRRRPLRDSAIGLMVSCVLRCRLPAKVHCAKLQPLLLLLLLWRGCWSAVGGVAAKLQLPRLCTPCLLLRRLTPGHVEGMTICVLRAAGSGGHTVGCSAIGAADATAARAARPHGIEQLLRADRLLAYRLRLLLLVLLQLL